MDLLVLSLASCGLALTAAGSVASALDVTARVRTYRRAVRKADAAAARDRRDPVLNVLKHQQAQNVGWELERQRLEIRHGEARLSALAGAAEGLRSLWLSAAVLFAGVALSGTADIVAALHAH